MLNHSEAANRQPFKLGYELVGGEIFWILRKNLASVCFGVISLKNIHTLLRMLAAVKERIHDVHLCIVGEEDDISLGEFRVRNTGYLDWLHIISNDLEVENLIHFVGPLFGEDLARMYSAADVVVNLGYYHRENFGLSQAEAASCGTPVVCTSWGGFKDVVQIGQTGYSIDAVLTKNGIRVDWARGANVITELLQQSDLREEMGSKSVAFAKEHFSLSALTTNLESMLEEVLQTDMSLGVIAYEPSEFAKRYEANKRESGWYAANPTHEAHWFPPMFQGKDYEIYETLMQPYSTRLAEEWAIDSLTSEHVPYFPSPVTLDSMRFLICNDDPIWPHRRFLLREEWGIIVYVDGIRTIEVVAEMSGISPASCAKLCWSMYVEGFILFVMSQNQRSDLND